MHESLALSSTVHCPIFVQLGAESTYLYGIVAALRFSPVSQGRSELLVKSKHLTSRCRQGLVLSVDLQQVLYGGELRAADP